MSQVPNKGATLVSANGAISPSGAYTLFVVTKVTSPQTICAMTLAAPAADGQEIDVVDGVGQDHTLTATSLVNGGGKSLLTWGGTIGSTLGLIAYNGYWWVKSLQGVSITS